MKKLLCAIIAVALVSTLFLIPVSAESNVIGVEFKGDHIKPLAADDPAQLYDGSVLSDADAAASDFNKPGILLVQNTNCNSEEPSECTIIFELDSLQSIDTVYINWYVYCNAMIGLPQDNALIVGTSKDGVSFNEIAWTMEGEVDLTTSYQIETVVDLGATVDAKFVSVSFFMGPNGQGWDKVSWEWIGLTELGAGLKSEGGPNLGEVSQEESIDLDDIEPIVEVPAGAKFIKHVPFNKSITTGSSTIITDPATVSNFNVAWSACVLLRPTEVEGQYSVVAVKAADGDYEFAFEGVEEGDIALAVHGDDTVANSTANRDALAALVEGDIVTFAGYNFAEETFETGAVVYYAVPAEKPDEPSEEPSDDSSEPADESVEDESTPADDDKSEDASVPATGDDKSDEGGNTGLIIGIVAGVVAVIAVVVVVVIVVKKKK
ncbi:MAG: hypothetical protein IKV01_00030 [Clostridia bacterium]|nr:hypothetical protein [Clostridia bacterium]